MGKKMFVFDLDGTLLTVGDQYNQSAVAKIGRLREKGHYAVVATGRHLKDILRISPEFANKFDFFICNNGAYYYDTKKQKNVFGHLVPNEVAKHTMDVGQKSDTFFTLHTTDGVLRTDFHFEDHELKASILNEEWGHFVTHPLETIKKAVLSAKITQVSLRSSREIVQGLRHFFHRKYENVIKTRISGQVYLDINPLHVSKLEGIRDVCGFAKLKLENVVAFGDSGNDVEMLEGVGKSFAMANGTPEAKKAASEVIGDNFGNAISKKVLEFLGEKC